jgi:hypothetical protein
MHFHLLYDAVRVVILGVQRLTGGRVVLPITSGANQADWTYSLNILLKYLEYTRICLNILEYFLVGRARRSIGRGERARRQPWMR